MRSGSLETVHYRDFLCSDVVYGGRGWRAGKKEKLNILKRIKKVFNQHFHISYIKWVSARSSKDTWVNLLTQHEATSTLRRGASRSTQLSAITSYPEKIKEPRRRNGSALASNVCLAKVTQGSKYCMKLTHQYKWQSTLNFLPYNPNIRNIKLHIY